MVTPLFFFLNPRGKKNMHKGAEQVWQFIQTVVGQKQKEEKELQEYTALLFTKCEHRAIWVQSWFGSATSGSDICRPR